MNPQKNLYKVCIEKQVASAVETLAVRPLVLDALLNHLMLSTNYVAQTIGVSPSTLSNWASGRTPISARHTQRLTTLLRVAITTAQRTINVKVPRDAFEYHALKSSYQQRVDHAQDIYNMLVGENVGRDPVPEELVMISYKLESGKTLSQREKQVLIHLRKNNHD
nr:hypothetical protein 5 [Gammaproteobacteria bacterium]